jgi:hypothetical protein
MRCGLRSNRIGIRVDGRRDHAGSEADVSELIMIVIVVPAVSVVQTGRNQTIQFGNVRFVLATVVREDRCRGRRTLALVASQADENAP